MRLNALLLSSLLLAIAVATPARADNTPTEHYRWKDASGLVHYSDTIPSSALAGGYDIVDNQGVVVRHVGRELTPAERRVAAAQAAQQAAAKHAAQQQMLADAQLMAAYPTATALAQAQQGQLKQIEIDIATYEGNLKDQESSLTDLLAHVANHPNMFITRSPASSAARTRLATVTSVSPK